MEIIKKNDYYVKGGIKMRISNLTQNLNPTVHSNGSNTSAQNSQASQKSSEKTGENQESNKAAAELTPKELLLIKELKTRDQEVRTHEMAHVAAGGSYIARGANYQYEKGPDGILYAISGDVLIDTSSIPNDPEQTIKKMDTIKKAALAPAKPSSADRNIAAKADSLRAEAVQELMKLNMEKSKEETGNVSPLSKALDVYEEAYKETDVVGSSINISA